ncbi:MAG: PaaI family thioesterase [Desulfobacterales bacterium]|jgi:uncharacterized protein (TIGR00369 family)|nr:PaaI family thioesterase [Desulfobacteraceae bacterium]MBT4363359.1 PaaI family thioesterase [Desulfobacteraceae bacterium]MBT7084648.1 PaaI family thioesterase [Desulfobacterales bacterium]MBT7698211.1 PaaI family thioesterase [Desulfobacterales bacterium]
MKIVNSEYIEELKKIVKNSPYPKHMAMELDHIEFDEADVVINLADYHLQPFGIVHGGVIATMIDTVTFWAAFLRLPENDGLVNVDLKLNFLQPVTDGRLVAKGTCLRPGNSISYSEAKVFDKNEKLVAHGTSTLMVQPGKGLKLNHKKFL